MIRVKVESYSAAENAQMKQEDLMRNSNKIQLRTVATSPFDSRRAVGWIPFLCFVLVICLLALSHSDASETPSVPHQDWIIPVPHPLTSLLRAEQVHLELALSPVQVKDIEKAVGEADLPLWQLRDLPAQERNESAGPLIQRLTARLSQILSAQQEERLNQIVWQALSIEAVLEPEVAARLGLSSEQLSDIVAVLNTLYNRNVSLQMNTTIRPESRKIAYSRKLRAEAERSVLAVLNTRQRDSLAALMGHPFDLSQIRGIVCKAPEFQVQVWLNSAPLKISDLKGKVTVIHFYAFGCGNCIRNLPHYNDWHGQYGAKGLQIVGIHRPETQREYDIEKVREKAVEAGMDYPIAIDNKSLCWDLWANRVWPSIYLVDKNGFVRYWWYGELNWQGTETEKLVRNKIEELLEERS